MPNRMASTAGGIDLEEHSVKMSRMRKQIAENLRHSCSHNPTVSIFGLFDFTKLLEMKAAYAAKGQKIPDTAIFMKAATICRSIRR